MKKIIIAGGRDFQDYIFLKNTLDELFKNIIDKKNIEIVSGHAKGVDSLGEKYAKENNINLKIFPADWNTYGKSAGYIRNVQMKDYADYLIAFWNSKSKGTKNMIDLMKKANKKIKIIYY